MSYPKSSNPRHNFGVLAFFLPLLIVFIGYGIYRQYMDRVNYQQGNQAYQQAQCKLAIYYFDMIINAKRPIKYGDYLTLARRNREVCISFQVAVDLEQAGEFDLALAAYSFFISSYQSSELKIFAQTRAQDIFDRFKVSELVGQESCQQIDLMAQGNIITQPEITIPAYYHACGLMYAENQDWDNAVIMYEKFLKIYPNHELAAKVEIAFAQAIVAQAKINSGGNIPEPQKSGDTNKGTSKVIIQNDSPEELRIVFSGPESKVVTLEACKTCKNFVGVGPGSCPEKGPVGQTILLPGQYDIAVQSTASSQTKPWTGQWILVDGSEYSSCFYIVTTVSP